MQTILGAGGAIGSPLAAALTAYTDKVRLVSRNPKRVNPTDELYPADLSDPGVVDAAVAGSDIVYLTVGFEYNLKVWQQCWPPLMRAVIDACVKHGAGLVFFDNVYVYDSNSIGAMTEDSPVNPPSKKGAVRRQIADMMMEAVASGRITGLIARSADFYGPNNEKSMLTQLVLNNLQKGKKSQWVIDADKKHSFTYTPDAARATALLGNTEDAYNQVWHLPTDPNALTGREIVALIAGEMKAKPAVTVLSMAMIRLISLFVPVLREMPEMMYQYDRDYIFNSSKFSKRFHFPITTYSQGIRATCSGGIHPSAD